MPPEMNYQPADWTCRGGCLGPINTDDTAGIE
jgi:hypothetical protein